MLERPPRPVGAALDAVAIHHIATPQVDEYLTWYRKVGEQWDWVDRVMMDPAQLNRILQDDRVDFYLLRVQQDLAGYCELDRRVEGEVEFAYFGLFPQFIGRGLGGYFLQEMLQRAWDFEPSRVWLHTCDLDHPAALANYQKAGFQVYDEKYVDQVLPGGAET